MHWSPIPGKDSKQFCPLSLGIRVAKENNTVKHWMEEGSTYIEKRQSKITFNGGLQFPMASGSLPVTGCRAVHLCTPLWCLSGRNPVPSPRKTNITVGLVRCHVMHRFSAETKEYSSSLKQGKLFTQVDKLGTVCMNAILVRRCSRSKTHSLEVEWGWKVYMQETAFANSVNNGKKR